ncbi:hypothetical protein GLYMA_13G137250v4 [Glycine max]|nr:hypothetical protein GLYMA_13G137250v4 [Glycine max]KAH1101401.1 hypothetical protein GYH30_036121 [Glycine max]
MVICKTIMVYLLFLQINGMHIQILTHSPSCPPSLT